MAGQHRPDRLTGLIPGSGATGGETGSLLVPIAVGVAGLALIVSGQLFLNRPSIEEHLTQASVVALRSNGIAGAQVTFSGRDAEIVVAGSGADVTLAQSVVKGVTGVRTASSVGSGSDVIASPGAPAPPSAEPSDAPSTAPSTAPSEPATPTATPTATPSGPVGPVSPIAAGRLPVGLTFDGGLLTVTGSVPSQRARTIVVAAITKAGGWTIVDRLQIDDRLEVADRDWVDSLTGLVKSVPGNGSKVVARFDGDQVIVRGTPADPKVESAILQAALATVNDRDEVLDGLDVPGTS